MSNGGLDNWKHDEPVMKVVTARCATCAARINVDVSLTRPTGEDIACKCGSKQWLLSFESK